MCGCATLLFESLSSLAGCSTSEGTGLVPTCCTHASHQNASCGVDLLCYERGVCRRRVGCTAAVATSAIQPILAAVQRAVARGGAHFAKAAAYTGGIFLYDFRPDPPWQRDGITLLAYVGLETLLRSAATVGSNRSWALIYSNLMLPWEVRCSWPLSGSSLQPSPAWWVIFVMTDDACCSHGSSLHPQPPLSIFEENINVKEFEMNF